MLQVVQGPAVAMAVVVVVEPLVTVSVSVYNSQFILYHDHVSFLYHVMRWTLLSASYATLRHPLAKRP